MAIRNDAPEFVRQGVVSIAYDSGLSVDQLRKTLCGVLRKLPDRSNWSADNIERENSFLVEELQWFEVYDLVELLHSHIRRNGGLAHGVPAGVHFDTEINTFFRAGGIGWQLTHGALEVRGSESFESVVSGAISTLSACGRITASQELHEAIRDLSRRPIAEITGAIQHGMAALECVARDAANLPKETLGSIVKQRPDLFPPAVAVAVSSAWGYASNFGRHLVEGRPPDYDEAELIVGLSGVLCQYLSRKFPSGTR